MMSVRAILSCAVLAASLGACSSQYLARYDLALREVERPADRQPGPQAVVPVDSGFVYEDPSVRFEWTPSAEGMRFVLRNKTPQSIRVLWDDAAYVDKDGRSQRVMHTGVPFVDRAKPQPPSVVVRGGHLEDVIIPTENVRYNPAATDWTQVPVFPLNISGKARADSITSTFLGESVQVLLPLEISGAKHEYIFSFVINRVCYWPWGASDGSYAAAARRSPHVRRLQDRQCKTLAADEFGEGL